MRVWLLALAAACAGCTVSRDIPLEQFVCPETGAPCDAGTGAGDARTGPSDALSQDQAGPLDSGAGDGGFPPDAADSRDAAADGGTPDTGPRILYQDQFAENVLDGWVLVPAGFWSTSGGKLHAGGVPSEGNFVEDRATRGLPSRAITWEAKMVTTNTEISNHLLFARTSDFPLMPMGTGYNSIGFGVNERNELLLVRIENGHYVSTSTIGHTDRTVEHTYQIRLDSDLSFTLLLDGTPVMSALVIGPDRSTWAGGFYQAALITQTQDPGVVMTTTYRDVIARGF